MNVFLGSQLLVSFPSLWVTVHLASNTGLVSGSVVGTPETLIWSSSSFFLPLMFTSGSVLSVVGPLNVLLYIHRHKVCLDDCVDLICSLYHWWEGFGFYSLVTLPLGFNRGFISTSACESPTGFYSSGCPGGLGSAPGRVGCGGGVAGWVTGALVLPDTQGSWRLRQQVIWGS